MVGVSHDREGGQGSVTGSRLHLQATEWATAWPGQRQQTEQSSSSTAADERWRRRQATRLLRATQGQGRRELVGLGTAGSLGMV